MTLSPGPALTALLTSPLVDARNGEDDGMVIARLDAARCRGRRAIRSLLHQRLAQVQAAAIGRPEVRRAVLVLTVGDDEMRRSLYGTTQAAADSVLQRLEASRGLAFGLVVILDVGAATAADLQDLTRAGRRCVPEGAAVIAWEEARARGLRAAVFAHRV